MLTEDIIEFSLLGISIINWNTGSVNTKDKNSKEIQFIETIRDNHLDQIIKQPTRHI